MLLKLMLLGFFGGFFLLFISLEKLELYLRLTLYFHWAVWLWTETQLSPAVLPSVEQILASGPRVIFQGPWPGPCDFLEGEHLPA